MLLSLLRRLQFFACFVFAYTLTLSRQRVSYYASRHTDASL